MDLNHDARFENATVPGGTDHSAWDPQRLGYSDPAPARDGCDATGAIAYALGRLATELAPELTYHNLFHTQDDVLPAIRRLAALTGVNAEETTLLEVAAAYHDLGYLVQREEHERAGVEIAGLILPGFGFGPEQVAAIQGMILATRLPQTPRNLLEALMADADLDVLGRPDSLPRAEALREELTACGHATTNAEWCASQLDFMRGHHYFTPAARSLRDAGKARAIAIMEARASGLAPDRPDPADPSA